MQRGVSDTEGDGLVCQLGAYDRRPGGNGLLMTQAFLPSMRFHHPGEHIGERKGLSRMFAAGTDRPVPSPR